MIHIRVISGTQAGEEIKTRRGALTIGRGPECHLRVADSKVSHFHGEFVGVGPRFIYRDFLSRNGSCWKRGEEMVWLGPLNPEWEVQAGDELQAGDTSVVVLAVEPERNAIEDVSPATYIVEATGKEGAYVAELTRFRKFLQFRSYDPTDLRQAKMMLRDALLEAYPQADGVTLVEARFPAERALQREDLATAEMVTWSSDDGALSLPAFSFHVLREAARQGGTVLFTTRPDAHFPEAQSIRDAHMRGCLCAPWWQGDAIAGFIHLHTSKKGAASFTRTDAQLLSLLAGVASVVLQAAAAAEERVLTRTLASIGQIVGALAHDASAILRTLGMNVGGVESEFPALTRSDAWQSLRADLDFLSFFTRDTMQQIRAARLARQADLQLQQAPVSPVITASLDRCRRYFLEANDAVRIDFVDASQLRHEAVFDPMALTQILVNCLKNALDTLKARNRQGTVLITCTEPPAEAFLRLHICDDAGGIPREVLERLGKQMVSTRGDSGAGLGTMIILDLMRRMHGHVLMASSIEEWADCPAGTIVSLCLPKTSATGARDGHPPFKLITNYRQYRARITAGLSAPHHA